MQDRVTVDLVVDDADVRLQKDGTWVELDRPCTRSRNYPEKWYVLIQGMYRTGTLWLAQDHTYSLTLREQPALIGDPTRWVNGNCDESFYNPTVLGAVRAILNDGPLILEHRILSGGSAPYRLVLESEDELIKYIHEETKPGDELRCWDFDDVCRDDKVVAEGKIPDADGRVIRGGPY